MSSPISPGLTTEGLARPLERVAVVLSLLMAAGLPWLAAVPRALLVSLALPVTLALIWRKAGWLGGPAAVRRADWDRQGAWRLRLGDGSVLEGQLTPGSRMLGPLVYLAWRTARGRRSMLLAGPGRHEALRRLVVRLRLEADGESGRASNVPDERVGTAGPRPVNALAATNFRGRSGSIGAVCRVPPTRPAGAGGARR